MNSTNIINKIKKEIKINKKLLEEANKIDIKYDNKKIEFTKIFEIIDYFLKISESSISKTKVKEYVFIYYGDIYMTLYFALVAILINKKINLFMDEYLIGINNVLLEIINSVLKENKLDLINYSFGYKINEIKEIPDKEIFVIGNSTIYQEIYSLNNLRFIPFFNLIIYFDEHISQKKQELLANSENISSILLVASTSGIFFLNTISLYKLSIYFEYSKSLFSYVADI